jgi:hypothetical protein
VPEARLDVGKIEPDDTDRGRDGDPGEQMEIW